MNNIKNFLEKISGFDLFSDGFIEVVKNYNCSKYFPHDQIDAVIKYTSEMAKAGHDVHFGPAVRKDDLGINRSARANVLWTKCMWVDVDSPDKTLSADEKLKAAEKLKDDFIEALKGYGLEPSFINCSGHGFHIYFVLKQIHMDPSVWTPTQNALISLAKADVSGKDETRLLRVPGTMNWKEKNYPKKVEIVFESDRTFDLNDFAKILKDYGQKKDENVPAKQSIKMVSMPECIEHLFDQSTKVPLGYRHNTRLILARYAFQEHWTEEDVIKKVCHFTSDPKKSAKDIKNIYRMLKQNPDAGKLGCGDGSYLRNLVEAGITRCNKDSCVYGTKKVKSTADKNEAIKSADFPGLVDLVLDDHNEIAYLVKQDQTLVIEYEHTIDGKRLVPPSKMKILWKLPKASAVQKHFVSDSDSALFNDLVDYLKTVSDLPDENHYYFLAAYVMHTYLTDKFEYSPMVWFYAIPERGKTRTGKAMIYSSFRGVHIITVREAHLIRLAQDFKATIFFDVSDLQKKADMNGVEDVLLNRYERGAIVARVLYPEKGAFDDTVYYEIYGATIAATNETVNDAIATRAVQIIMPEACRQFTSDVKPNHGLPFRERLLGFRARWLDNDLPNVEKPCLNRLGDILIPIRQIVSLACQDETWFIDFVAGVQKRKKLAGADGLDAQVVEAIKDAMPSITQGHMTHDAILAKLNYNKAENENISSQKLGKITSRLGFDKYNSGQKRGIYANFDLLCRLCERFGIEPPLPIF